MNRSTILTLVLVCVILTVSLFGVIANYSLSDENRKLENQLALYKNKQLTLVFHVSEKGPQYPYAQLPNASYTYDQIQALNNNTYQILLLPEYKGNLNWTEEQAWLSTNFGGPDGIPIMLDVFGGGSESTPTPMLTTAEISQAMSVVNVKYIRIAEVASWHLENHLSFPTSYLRELLEFSRQNDLKVFWTEWKNDFPTKNVETFSAIQTYIAGYEDIVTVSFSTNSQELEPADGFLKLDQMFANWGASIQPWYWNTTRNQNLMDMPASLILEHSLAAKGLGAKIIQFEPYWYLFKNDGTPDNNLQLILSNLVSATNQ